MSYDVTKLTQLAHLKSLAEKVAAECATKTELQALSSKVDGLVSAGGEANVLEGVKVNGTALSIAEKMVDLVIASGTTNGTISVNNADVAVKGLAALAYKAQVSQSDLDSALNAVIAAKAEQSAVTSLQGEITTLKGSGEGSVKKAIDDAINQFATNVSDDDVVNSFKELVDWAAEHGSEAAEMSAGIQENKNAVQEINASIETMNTEIAKKVDKVEGSRLMTNDEGTKLSGIAANATKVEKSNTNGNVKINGSEIVVYTLPGDVVRGSIASGSEVSEMLNEVFAAQVQE